jgi:hypothetical protein
MSDLMLPRDPTDGTTADAPSQGGSVVPPGQKARPSKAQRNASCSSNDMPISPCKFIQPLSVELGSTSYTSILSSADSPALRTQISDASSELILADMVDIEGETLRDARAKEPWEGILSNGGSNSGSSAYLGSLNTSDSMIMSGKVTVIDGTGPDSESSKVLYLKDYLSNVEGARLEGDLTVNQRVRHVPTNTSPDKSRGKTGGGESPGSLSGFLAFGSSFLAGWFNRPDGTSGRPPISASGKDSASSALTLSSTSEKGDVGGEVVVKASLPVAIGNSDIKFAKTQKETEEGYRRSLANSYEREGDTAATGRAAPSGHGGGYSGVGTFHYSSSPSVLHLVPNHPGYLPHQPHHHTLKPPRNVESKGVKRDYVYDREEAMRQFVRKFRARYEVNPFRKEDGSGFLQTRTHNRRRWSHIFPSGEYCGSISVF